VRHGDHGVVVDLKHLSVLIFRHFNEVRIPGTKKKKKFTIVFYKLSKTSDYYPQKVITCFDHF
jgi:hypothetical protein